MSAKPPVSRLKSYTPQAIVSAPPGERKHILRRFWFPAVILLALAAGGLSGIIAAYQLNYSQAASEVAALATYRPSIVTRIYADDEQTLIGEFALEKRIPLKFEEIPPVMKNAILAVGEFRKRPANTLLPRTLRKRKSGATSCSIKLPREASRLKPRSTLPRRNQFNLLTRLITRRRKRCLRHSIIRSNISARIWRTSTRH